MASAKHKHKYQTLVECAPDPIFLIDPETELIVEANVRAAELLGYDQSTIEAMSVTDLHPADDIDAYRSLFKRTLAEGQIRSQTLEDGGQIYVVTNSGEQIPVEFHARTIDIQGEQHVYGIVQDISERYAKRQRIEAQKERLERFTKVVSHDLRNPLAIANGQVGLARDETDSEHLEKAAHSLDRMEALITDLLELSNDVELDPAWVTPEILTHNCWSNVQTPSASLRVDAESEIYADEHRLQQLFENLMRNAIEHAGDEPTITIGGLDGGFYLEDDGPGIPQADREQVFEMGYSSTEQGTGFGLNIVKQVVTDHGWSIAVTEGSDGGARFEITGVETR